MYSVAEKYWIKLWENAYPQSKLLKNHRFACLQLFQYNLKHRPLRILVTGKSNIGKTDLLLQFTRQKRLSDFEVYHVQPDHIYKAKIQIDGRSQLLEMIDVRADLDGENQFLSENYYEKHYSSAHGIILCTDLTEKGVSTIEEKLSKYSLLKWEHQKNLSAVIVVTCSEAERSTQKQQIVQKRMEKFAMDYSLKIISTRTQEAFAHLANAILEKLNEIYTENLEKNPDWIRGLENGDPIEKITHHTEHSVRGLTYPGERLKNCFIM